MGFDEWYKKVGVARHYIYANEKWIAKIGFEAGAASRQAEIDELQKRLAMYEREGYKLVPVEPTIEMINAARGTHEGEPILPYSFYKAMIGAVE